MEEASFAASLPGKQNKAANEPWEQGSLGSDPTVHSSVTWACDFSILSLFFNSNVEEILVVGNNVWSTAVSVPQEALIGTHSLFRP